MIRVSPEASAQIDALLSHYERLERPEAVQNLLAALVETSRRIERAPAAGLPAPRPYPALGALGLRWVKEGSYWMAYSADPPLTIISVFYETANIPKRINS